MKLLIVLLATATSIAFMGDIAFTEEWSPAQKEVWKMQEAYFDARIKGDKKGALAFFHEKCSLWPHRELSPIDKTTLRLSTIRSLKLKPMAINVIDNVAITHFYFSMNVNGQDMIERATTIWMKESGKWLIIGTAIADCEYPAACGWRP